MLFDGVHEFVRVAQAGSFTEAARQLGVTPSATSKAVARLEAALGVRLLNRTSRSVTLTSDGETFLATAAPAVGGIEEARNQFKEHDPKVQGLFRLSIPSAFGSLYLDDVVTKLAADHPELRLDVSVTDELVDLTRDRIDLALRFGELPDSQLVAKRVIAMSFWTIASPAYLKVHGDLNDVDDLSDHTRLGFRNRGTGRVRQWTFKTAEGPQTVAPTDQIVVDDPLAYRSLLLAGIGIGQAPSYLVADDVAKGRLNRLLPKETDGELTLSFVFPRPLGRSRRLRAVMEALEGVIHANS
ncbi:MAG: LysR family transcriptional regulator [Pseudomonadota bacterium]